MGGDGIKTLIDEEEEGGGGGAISPITRQLNQKLVKHLGSATTQGKEAECGSYIWSWEIPESDEKVLKWIE